MRDGIPIFAPLCLALALAWPAAAQVEIPAPDEPPVALPPVPETLTPPEPPEEEDRAAALDALFSALAAAGERDWRPIQQQIMATWARNESPSMTFLLARATRAMEKKDYDTALAFLDDLVRLAPDYAEAWNRRATLYFLKEEYGHSLADIQRTLALEPRHFGALAGLGIILDRLDRDADAYEVFQRALEIHPHLEGAKEAVERLEPDVRGRDL